MKFLDKFKHTYSQPATRLDLLVHTASNLVLILALAATVSFFSYSFGLISDQISSITRSCELK